MAPSNLNLCIGDAKQVIITIYLSSLFVVNSPSIDAVGTLLLGTLLGLRVCSASTSGECAHLCSALTHASLAYKLQ